MFRYCHQFALVAQKPPTRPTECPGGKLFDYWIENNIPTLERDHPTEKPIGLIKYLMQPASTIGSVVVDLFGGIGTTAMAAKELGRQCILIEIEERNCEVAARRCCQEVMEFASIPNG
jgi:DNA modification methylase